MNLENETKPESSRSSDGGRIKFLFLALTPMPVGFLFNPARLFDYAQGNRSGSGPIYVFGTITLILCILGAIGMFGGFAKGKWGARLAGVTLGLALWILEMSLIIFIGCCAGFSHLGPT